MMTKCTNNYHTMVLTSSPKCLETKNPREEAILREYTFGLVKVYFINACKNEG